MLKRLDSFAHRRHALDRAVDLWLLDPTTLSEPTGDLAVCLSDAERVRLVGLRIERDRALYLAAHVFLRHLLSL